MGRMNPSLLEFMQRIPRDDGQENIEALSDDFLLYAQK